MTGDVVRTEEQRGTTLLFRGVTDLAAAGPT